MAKLTWTTNVTTWYEFEFTDEELKMYKENEDAFFDSVDVFGSATIVREKELEGDMEFRDDESYDDEDEDYDDED